MAGALNPGGREAWGIPQRRSPARTNSRVRCVALLLLLFGVAGECPCSGQGKPDSKLLFLVARKPIVDPFFEHSVVLMVPLKGEDLVVGLIVNKPTRVPLLQLFPASSALKGHSDNAFVGGPVDMASPALVFHSSTAAKQALLLYGDVYLSFDLEFISRLMEDPQHMGVVRLFLGRAQWLPEQLEGEALRGSWYSLRAEGAVIFDRDSEHLWKRLHDRARPPMKVQYRLPHGPPPKVRTEAKLRTGTSR